MANPAKNHYLKNYFCLLALSFILTFLIAAFVYAGDSTVPVDPRGIHATISTSDGSIRDDDFADYVCEQIKKNGGKVKDVKIMLNSCFGGGVLDDFQRVFGAGGACEGIKWVGGSASASPESAWGWNDSTIAKPGNGNLGSTWTDAAAGEKTSPTDNRKGTIRDRKTDNVKEDLEGAKNNDDSGPNGDKSENPVVGSGNGGDSVKWHEPGTKHHAVIFGGSQTNERHHNNVDNVENALKEVWPEDQHDNINKVDGGSTQDLKDAIADACENLDENTQLFIYIDDHGDTELDFRELIGLDWDSRMPINIAKPLQVSFDLHAGWPQALQAMHDQPGDVPAPTLDLTLANTIQSDDWQIMLNDCNVPLPGGSLTPGTYKLHVDWQEILASGNELTISTLLTDANMDLDELQLSSGPINETEITFPPVNVSQSDQATVVYEQGSTSDSYTIVLSYPPTAIVNIHIDPAGGGTGDANDINLGNGPGQPKNISFTVSNWSTPKTITVTAVNDNDPEGDQYVNILHEMTSSDPNFDDKSFFVPAEIYDNDVPGIIIDYPSTDLMALHEQGQTADTYYVSLASQPTGPVSVTIDPNGGGAADEVVDIGAGPGQSITLVFGSGNWNTPQTVTVQACDDSVAQGGDYIPMVIHTSSSGDPNYQGLRTASDIIATVEDNECGGWGYAEMDFNRDCQVSLEDLAAFAQSWLNCTVPYASDCTAAGATNPCGIQYDRDHSDNQYDKQGFLNKSEITFHDTLYTKVNISSNGNALIVSSCGGDTSVVTVYKCRDERVCPGEEICRPNITVQPYKDSDTLKEYTLKCNCPE